MKLSWNLSDVRLKAPFKITGKVFETAHVLTVRLEDGAAIGQGEGLGVYYVDPAPEMMLDQIKQVEAAIIAGAGRLELQSLLPPGGARNALDCAFWDLECKRSGVTIWQKLNVEPRPLVTAHTIGIQDSVAKMAEAAKSARCSVLKIKLDAQQPVERMQAIRAANPNATLLVDVNQGWNFTQLVEIAPALAALDVAMIEQPLPRGSDSELEGYSSPVPLCADESCLHLGEFEQASRRYQMINIKLDKCGGLTEALTLVDVAADRGVGVMVGNMLGTSRSMAPGFIIALRSKFVDLDGPLFLESDVEPSLRYTDDGMIFPPESALWG